LVFLDECCSAQRKTRCGLKAAVIQGNLADSRPPSRKTRSGACEGRRRRAMEIEVRQLDRRYEVLRSRSTSREGKLLASLAEVGQQTPIVVVRDGEQWVVVDGYKRVRALTRLGHDTVRATAWELSEADALLLERILRSGESDSALEQGWLMHVLGARFGLGRDELARRFDRTPSWVSRRLALVVELPASVQEHVRAGTIGSHAAMKYLVPLARANVEHCVRLADAIAPARPTSRQMAELYAAYMSAGVGGRELVVSQPLVVLRARAESAADREQSKRPIEQLLEELRIVSAVARRARHRIGRGAMDDAEPDEREEARRTCTDALSEVESLMRKCAEETAHAG
jgi:ParB family transcriptional regulator, chromosome partitioning protein